MGLMNVVDLKENLALEHMTAYLEMLGRTVNLDIAPLIHVRGGAPFAIAREVLCYLDHLGALLSGRTSSKGMSEDAKAFIARYLARIDEVYSSGGVLLYEMYRHGTVHNFAPLKVHSNGVWYEWLLFNGGRSERIRDRLPSWPNGPGTVKHLVPFYKGVGEQYLPVSTECLVVDLLESIWLYRGDLKEDGDLRQRMQTHLGWLSRGKNLDKMHGRIGAKGGNASSRSK